jgi:ABC-type branched-subunit amino acid transport system ATPase component
LEHHPSERESPRGHFQAERPTIAGNRIMRLKNLRIQDFRSFDRFELKNLGHVNLLVGTNNCGKTTVLEAVNILMANGDFTAIWSTLVRRGEDIYGERDPTSSNSGRQVDIRRLFRGHEIEVGKSFQFSADTDFGSVSMVARIDESRPEQQQLFETEPQSVESSGDFLPPLTLSLHWPHGASKEMNIPISRRGGISSDAIRRSSQRFVFGEGFPIRFITASSLTSEAVSGLFEEIVLTPEEDLVTQAMQIIEPNIERIASTGSEKIRSAVRLSLRGGILVRLKDIKDRVPIGSMGDGIWRILGLALAVVQSDKGILLVDEIDTGLHHTVMQDMWRFLYSCAKKYDVQIIATTHSWDCYHSLAVICRDEVSEGSDVTISRVERGRVEAVGYTEQEIVAVADRDIEVR